MTRSVSSALLTAVGAGATQPVYFVEIQWPTFSSYLCSHSTQTWNGTLWVGGGYDLVSFDESGRPQQLLLADPDFAYRTLVLANGIRDRRINVWMSDVAALDVGDPVKLFGGFADRAEMGGGRMNISLERNTSSRQFTPRERIGPGIGVNFIAPPGLKVFWSSTWITLEAR